MKLEALKPFTQYDSSIVNALHNDGTIIDFDDEDEVYMKEDVDKALGEKDALLNDFREMQRQLAEKCGRLEDAIDKKDDEIAELKQKLENVQASMYCDVVDANMENRRLRRALWIARANRADGEFIYWCARLAMESGFTKADIRGYSVNTKRKLRTIGEWIEVWKNVKSKCLKKAEEYK